MTLGCPGARTAGTWTLTGRELGPVVPDMTVSELKQLAENATRKCPGCAKDFQSGKAIMIHAHGCCEHHRRPFEKAACPRVVAALCDVAMAGQHLTEFGPLEDTIRWAELDSGERAALIGARAALAALDEAMRDA